VRSATRTLLAGAPAAAVIAVAWLRFEQPLGGAPWRAAALVVLALSAAALPGWRLRAAGSVVAAIVAARLAFGVWLPLHPVAGCARVGTDFGNGFLDFYATHLPFDPPLHVQMADVVLLAVFCFALLVALVAAARKPVGAALALLVGAGWPATLLGPSQAIAMGAAILVAGLAVLAVAGSPRVPALAAPVAAVLALAAVAVGTATAAHGAVHWQAWNPVRGSARDTVSFVWDAQYRGLHWPRKRTVVLDVESHARPGYLRAAVLDDFAGDRWVTGAPRAADALEPSAALNPANETKQLVTVEGLSDIHLVGGSIPIRFASSVPIDEPERGLAVAPAGLARGASYTVWSYAPGPTQEALSRVGPDYPKALLADGMLGVGDGIQVPPFGAANREAELLTSLGHTLDLLGYLPLARLAERVTRGARTPYAAVADLERWFLVDGGFSYSNRPRVVGPPLVGFATRTRSGYCQFFAGAMALMLRYLGIPARVAVGFAAPRYDRASRTWVVTDHDAHAWVEVWFHGYGWLPFDPTPAAPDSGRGRLIARFTRVGGSGESGPAARAQVAKSKGGREKGGLSRAHLGHPAGARGAASRAGGGFSSGLLLLLAAVAAAVGAVVAAKEARRLARRLERDPRRLAAACREELASFLLDQGMEPARSATVRELGELVHRQLGVDAEPFVAAATAARFGRAEDAAGAARAARRELGALLADCRRYLTRRERLLGLVSLRSLVRLRPAVDVSASLGSTGS
jgi:hypothetical protein